MKAALINPQQAKQVIDRTWMDYIKPMTFAGHRLVLEVKEATRSLEQNARLWAMLGEISQQVTWHGRKLSPESWKIMFSASLKKQDVVPGIDGGFVVLGCSTSKMTVREMSDLMQLIEAFGAEHEVRFSAMEPA
jgi:hypothetical protein